MIGGSASRAARVGRPSPPLGHNYIVNIHVSEAVHFLASNSLKYAANIFSEMFDAAGMDKPLELWPHLLLMSHRQE